MRGLQRGEKGAQPSDRKDMVRDGAAGTGGRFREKERLV